MALTFAPDCLPLPRYGAPHAAEGLTPRAGAARTLATFPQRGPREAPLALGSAGFPGLTLDGERIWVSRQSAERQIDRLGVAYLRAERSAGAPPTEQLTATVDQLRFVEQGRPRAVKAELLGPVSLALQMTDEQERPLAYDPPFREALAQHVALRAAWVHDLIASAGAAPLIALDEPFLDALETPFSPLDWEEGGDVLARTLNAIPGMRAVCVAGKPRWETVFSLPVDLIFFDAYEHSASLVLAARPAAEFLARGGAVGWGIVPTDPPALAQEQATTLAHRFASSVEYLSAAGGVAPERIAARALISTSGGIAHLSPAQATQAVALCAEVSAAARALFGLDT